MKSNRYILCSAIVFTLIALAQAARAFLRPPAQFGGAAIPIGYSWLAAAVNAALAVWGFASLERPPRPPDPGPPGPDRIQR